ncbi:MAG: ribosome maturation factor [Chitinophagia bacterium]|nr:ribosome maturation factor [Chitinophagia bacterium]
MSEVIQQIYQLVEPMLDGTDMFIVNIKIKPTNNVKVFLDADSGLSIEKCVHVNRKLHHAITTAAMFPDDDFSLEVSSPGVDEPLTQQRQYRKNVGRKVTVTLADDREVTGMLKETGEEALVLDVKLKPRDKELTPVTIPLAEIKKTVVQIIF